MAEELDNLRAQSVVCVDVAHEMAEELDNLREQSVVEKVSYLEYEAWERRREDIPRQLALRDQAISEKKKKVIGRGAGNATAMLTIVPI
eukprot:255255-Pyramimonas_sp.AAC.1